MLNITITHSQTESVLFCIVDYESYFFLLVATFLIITFPNFFAFLCIYGTNIYRQMIFLFGFCLRQAHRLAF